MWSTIVTPVISGVANYFTKKQEIRKVELEGEIAVKRAEAKAKVAISEAKVRMAEKEQLGNADLDKMSMQEMKNSYKDEYILGLLSIPMIMAFVPEYQGYAMAGFNVIAEMPEWYQYSFIGIIVVVYGLRGLLTKVLERNKPGK